MWKNNNKKKKKKTRTRTENTTKMNMAKKAEDMMYERALNSTSKKWELVKQNLH